MQRATWVLLAAAAATMAPGALPRAQAWGGLTHEKVTADALGSVGWLDRYARLAPTPFGAMVRDVLGDAPPAGPEAFKFKDAGTRQKKQQQYLAATSGIADPALRRFAQHLLLSPQIELRFVAGEQGRPVSARQVLSTYSSEPDWGMDKGLDASRDQKIMGGGDPKSTSSQGFRHMALAFGKLGEAPARAQLFFDLGARAIEKGHPYWGFRLVAWGMHYLEDMGAPVHTNMLPTLKYVRLKGLLRVKDAAGKPRFNKQLLRDLVQASGQINANYHFLYERHVDAEYAGPEAERAAELSAAVRGDGKRAGWLQRLFAPRTIEGTARRRAWSRLSTGAIARGAIALFTGKFREPVPGAAASTVRCVDKQSIEQTVTAAKQPLAGESQRAFARRLRGHEAVLRGTARELRKTGAALRHAATLLGQRLGDAR